MGLLVFDLALADLEPCFPAFEKMGSRSVCMGGGVGGGETGAGGAFLTEVGSGVSTPGGALGSKVVGSGVVPGDDLGAKVVGSGVVPGDALGSKVVGSGVAPGGDLGVNEGSGLGLDVTGAAVLRVGNPPSPGVGFGVGDVEGETDGEELGGGEGEAEGETDGEEVGLGDGNLVGCNKGPESDFVGYLEGLSEGELVG